MPIELAPMKPLDKAMFGQASNYVVNGCHLDWIANLDVNLSQGPETEAFFRVSLPRVRPLPGHFRQSFAAAQAWFDRVLPCFPRISSLSLAFAYFCETDLG